ncbi:MAG: DUF86 domain-containing protein [Desulfuromusa sp.]|nr:DUF86 domain-containing protein [Desulfuromusa sp.]
MINGVILRKLESLDEVLRELESLGQVSIEILADDWLTRRAIERDLQVLVEIVLDICQRLISLANEVPDTTGSAAVKKCVELGVLSGVDPFRKMVQFRNFIVHRYEQVDIGILVGMVNENLKDFKQFKDEVLNYVRHS